MKRKGVVADKVRTEKHQLLFDILPRLHGVRLNLYRSVCRW